MTQIINDPGRSGRLAEALGSGIGTGLQKLAHSKLKQVLGNRQRNELQQAGYSPEVSNLVTSLSGGDPKQMLQYLQSLNPAALQNQETGEMQEPLFRRPESSLSLSNKEELEQRKYLRTHTQALGQDFQNAKKIYSRAKSMKESLVQNKEKWPTLSGLLPEEWQNVVQRDKDIRKYMRDANELVLLSGGARKGQMTNYKARLEQAAKVNLNQPYETQLEVLNDLIKDSESVFDTYQEFNRIRKENNGKIPLDIEEQIVSYGIENALEKSSPEEKVKNLDMKQEAKQQQNPPSNKRRNKRTGEIEIYNPQTSQWVKA